MQYAYGITNAGKLDDLVCLAIQHLSPLQILKFFNIQTHHLISQLHVKDLDVMFLEQNKIFVILRSEALRE